MFTIVQVKRSRQCNGEKLGGQKRGVRNWGVPASPPPNFQTDQISGLPSNCANFFKYSPIVSLLSPMQVYYEPTLYLRTQDS